MLCLVCRRESAALAVHMVCPECVKVLTKDDTEMATVAVHMVGDKVTVWEVLRVASVLARVLCERSDRDPSMVVDIMTRVATMATHIAADAGYVLGRRAGRSEHGTTPEPSDN